MSANSKIILLIFFIVIVLFFLLRRNKLDNDISNNHDVTCGNIIEMRAGKGINVIYSFEYKNKIDTFNESCPQETFEKYKKHSIYKLIVVIEKNNMKNHRIIATDEDFVKFNLKTEDTLRLNCKCW